MKITMRSSSGEGDVWGVNIPPYDGKCQQCERLTSSWAKDKQGKWLCIKCDYNNKHGK